MNSNSNVYTTDKVLFSTPKQLETFISTTSTPPTKKKQRLLSLDVLRGLTVFMMIVANNQPGGELPPYRYWTLSHKDFNGITPTDFIFPFFLMIMGYAMGIVFDRKIKNPDEKVGKGVKMCCGLIKVNQNWSNRKYQNLLKWIRIIRRTCLLFLLGFCAGFIDNIHEGVRVFKIIRIFAVLQRISICYFVNSLLLNLLKSIKVQSLIVANLHLLYILIMFTLPIPNCGTGKISKYCSAEGFIDKSILGKTHLWQNTYYYDPEGLLSTLTSISTTYIGVLYYKLAKSSKKNNYVIISRWFIFGSILIVIAFLNNYILFPWNKHIWSSAFVFITGGVFGLALGLVYFLIDMKKIQWWCHLFIWIGVNPLFMYIVPEYLTSILQVIYVNKDQLNLYDWCYKTLLFSWIQDYSLSSLIFGLVYESLFFPFAALFYWKKIYIKL